MEEEAWKPIPDYPGYEASNKGRVRSFKRQVGVGKWIIDDKPQRLLSPSYSRPAVMLRQNGKSKLMRIHSLVLLAFVGPRPEGMEACHYDGNPKNNSLENLRYDTRLANVADDARNGVPRGPRSVFTEEQVIEMRIEYQNGKSPSALAKKHGISAGYAAAICVGNALKSYGGPITRRTRVGGYAKRRGKQSRQSQFRGVSWDKGYKKWCAQIWAGGRKGTSKKLGYFDNEIEAAKVYNAAAREKYKGDEVALAIVLNKIEP